MPKYIKIKDRTYPVKENETLKNEERKEMETNTMVVTAYPGETPGQDEKVKENIHIFTKDGCQTPIHAENMGKPEHCGRGLTKCTGVACKFYHPPAWLVDVANKKAKLAQMKQQYVTLAEQIEEMEKIIAQSPDK